MEQDGRTPEERLLARRRLGTDYLADVKALIARAESAEAHVDRLLSSPSAYVGERLERHREFGTIRTTEVRE